MRLISFIGPDGTGTGFLDGDRLVPLLDWPMTDVDFLPDSIDDLRRRATVLEGAAGIDRASVQPLAAVSTPGKVICVGLNYREHAAEGGRPLPTRPLLFSKFSNAVIADGEPIVRPEGTHALDLEVELGVVIGSTARRVRAADALEHVAGYVVVNDVSARDWQGTPAALGEGEVGDGQWLRAKGSDTFLPVGAVFVTADEIPDPQGLQVRSWRIPVAGPGAASDGSGAATAGTDAATAIPMQDANTSDMIWPVAELIEYISRAITLEPGDIIATGTPSGVGVFRDPPVFLEPGDRVRCEIDGIGAVENPIVDWTDDPRDRAAAGGDTRELDA